MFTHSSMRPGGPRACSRMVTAAVFVWVCIHACSPIQACGRAAQGRARAWSPPQSSFGYAYMHVHPFKHAAGRPKGVLAHGHRRSLRLGMHTCMCTHSSMRPGGPRACSRMVTAAVFVWVCIHVC